MKRLLGLLGWLGVALVLVAVILRFWKPEMGHVYTKLALAGLVVTVLYAAANWREFSSGRNAQYGSIAAGSVLVFLAILVGINWVANRQNHRWDLTESKSFSLSDQTKQIVSNLKGPLHIKLYWASTNERPDSVQPHKDRLEQYQYLSKQVTVDYIDAFSKPTEAEKDGITAVPTLIFEYGGRTQRATSDDESAMANALKKVIEGKAKKIYFTQGHGERDPEDQQTRRGMKAAANALVDDNFEIAKLQIAQKGSIPADATVLVVGGATTDFLPQETDLLRAFLKNGGKVMLLIDPPEKGGTGEPTSVMALAKEWGITVGSDLVVDPFGQQIGADASVPVGMPLDHPITKNFGKMSVYRLARSVVPIQGGTDGHLAQTIVQTGDASWAETDVKGLYATGKPEKNLDKGDKAGPISIGVAVSAPASGAPASADPDAPKPESRLVVFGDSDFAANSELGFGVAGNGNLFLNAANWLAQQENLIAIRPKDPEDRRLTITSQDEVTMVFWGTVVVIPLLFFANGVRVYWRKRK